MGGGFWGGRGGRGGWGSGIYIREGQTLFGVGVGLGCWLLLIVCLMLVRIRRRGGRQIYALLVRDGSRAKQQCCQTLGGGRGGCWIRGRRPEYRKKVFDDADGAERSKSLSNKVASRTAGCSQTNVWHGWSCRATEAWKGAVIDCGIQVGRPAEFASWCARHNKI